MRFSPLNRNIHIELKSSEDEHTTESGLLLPEDYKPKSEYALARVIDVAPDCKLSVFDSSARLRTSGMYVVVLESMVEEITYAGKTFHVV